MQYRHLSLALVLAVSSACGIDDTLSPSDRPTPPPAEAFDLDLDFFDGKTPAPGGGTTAWAQALQTVSAARSDMQKLVVPGALLNAALSGTGTRDGDEWVWPYSTAVAGDPFDGELRSRIAGVEYLWNLTTTAPDHEPELTNFVIAEGRTDSRGFEGGWWLADTEAGTDSIVAAVSWIRTHENAINFAFAQSDSAAWKFERSSAGHVLTHLVYSQPNAIVTWYPDGSGSSWTTSTARACWNNELNDVVC